ncbi:hypothetical protein ABZ192_30015 [Streptomyces sp. NPDC006235]|uniref:hypothetical protein n=1 Tax=Streptomyces sp. NPDC006235 TaxID=3156736 RepID=UPI00339FB929
MPEDAERPSFRYEFDDRLLSDVLTSEQVDEVHGRLQVIGDLDLNGLAFPVLLRLRVVERAEDRLLVVGPRTGCCAAPRGSGYRGTGRPPGCGCWSRRSSREGGPADGPECRRVRRPDAPRPAAAAGRSGVGGLDSVTMVVSCCWLSAYERVLAWISECPGCGVRCFRGGNGSSRIECMTFSRAWSLGA